MHDFYYKSRRFCCESVDVTEVARSIGTPVYVYSHKTLTDHYKKWDRALSGVEHMICFSVKSSSNIAVIRALVRCGAGLDIVSGGELFRALTAGADPAKVVFAGVGKTEEEIALAIKEGILMFTVESMGELELINKVAGSLSTEARIAVRINPDVDPGTHKYLKTGKKQSKFGLEMENAYEVYEAVNAMPNVAAKGIQMHIGSQITDAAPYVESLEKMVPFSERVRKICPGVEYLDIGGGMGIVYTNETPATADDFAKAVLPLVKETGLKLIVEPGRFIAGNAGILVVKALYVKRTPSKTFVIVDGGMNDLIRPALYGARHEIVPVVREERETITADIVGPVCESGDFFAREREIPAPRSGELLAIMGAGAYCFSMSSNYNSRPRAAEVMVHGGEFEVVRKRETYEDLVRGESVPDFLL